MFFPFPNFEHVTRRVFKVKEIIHHGAITLRGKQNEGKNRVRSFFGKKGEDSLSKGHFLRKMKKSDCIP
jgi:hypothetical protein